MIALVLALLIVSAQNAAGGYSANPVVVMSELPDGDYEVGDEVTFTVNVFEKGERVDADNITVTVGWYFEDRKVNATPTGTPGVYEVTFTIQENDSYEGEIDIFITVEVGNVTSGDYIYFYLYEGEEEPEVEVEAKPTSSSLLKPGETFTCEVTVTEDGEAVNADDKDITLYGPEGTEKLNWTKTGKGMYMITYTVPDHITDYKKFSIHIYVDVGNLTEYAYATFTVLDIQVWYEKGSVNKTELVATFWVNDLDGNVVNGAQVKIEYDHDNDYFTARLMKSGTTVNGSVELTLPHANLTGIYVTITVKITNRTYLIGTGIDWDMEEMEEPEVPEPSEEEFDVVPEDMGYETGQHTYDFTAYNYSEPWASDWVYYYAGFYGSPCRKVLAFGKVKTNAEGEFSISFSTPSDEGMYIMIFFQAATGDAEYEGQSNDGRAYEQATVFLSKLTVEGSVKSSSVKISAKGALKLNDTNDFQVTIPGESGFLMVFIIPVDAEPDSQMEAYPFILWALILPADIPLMTGTQTVSVLLPAYLPEDQKFLFVVVSLNDEGLKYNYLMLKVGQSGGTGDDDDDDGGFFPGFEGITVAAALGVALVAMRRKRR